ncbi:MAG TPA: hypothetical protein VE263_05250 [Candidatus Angelobacter sp.]|nr:hypothetical protein [Candidatus Angelobacter sp.]
MRTALHCLACPFLLAALVASAAAQNPPADSKPQSSGDAAAGSAQPVKKAKHVYTDDDFASRRSTGSAGVDVSGQWPLTGLLRKDPITAKDFAEVQKLVLPSYQFNLTQTRASVANLYLQQYKDAAFDGRDEWENRLFTEFECTREAQADFVKKLDAVSKDPEYRRLLEATQLSEPELKKLAELRKQLIADWEPIRVCNAKFDVIRKEGWWRASEWLTKRALKPN